MGVREGVRRSAIGKYKLLRELGTGATSVVHLARDEFSQRDVAVKVIDAASLSGEEMMLFQRMFIAEATLVGKLRHPHVVELLDAGIDDHGCYIVMEYVDGGTLEEHCAPERLLPFQQVADIIYKCCKGLGFAQRNGLVHRDIKPANILLGRDGRIKVTDFGAAANARLKDITQVSGLGSAAYMSPQQLDGQTLTFHADIYSLGIVLFKLLTGRLPFSSHSILQLANEIRARDIAPPSQFRPDVPPQLDQVVQRATARDVAKRYASWDKFAEDLANFAARTAPKPVFVSEKDKYTALRTLPALKAFTDEELRAILPATAWRQFPPKAQILCAGDEGHSFFLLEEGELRVLKDGQQVEHLQRGDWFGEAGYLTRGRMRRMEDVVAASNARAVEFNPDLLWMLLPGTEKRFDAMLQDRFARRLAQANERLSRLLAASEAVTT
ncbi:MAG TPA: serine/threonine-protein kinase [Burkholderiales bacterium]